MKRIQTDVALGEAADRGLLDRRLLLRTAAVLGFIPGSSEFGLASTASAETSQLTDPEWSKIPGSPFVGYGQPSKFEGDVVRTATNPPQRTRGGRGLDTNTPVARDPLPQTGRTSSAVTVAFLTSTPMPTGY
jgi:hypothetical protein